MVCVAQDESLRASSQCFATLHGAGLEEGAGDFIGGVGANGEPVFEVLTTKNIQQMQQMTAS